MTCLIFIISHGPVFALASFAAASPTQTHTDLLFGRPAVAEGMAGQTLAKQKPSSRFAGKIHMNH